MEANNFQGYVEVSRNLMFDKYITVCAVICIFFSIFYLFFSNVQRKVPPGPVGLPLLGYYPFMDNDIFKSFSNLKKKYGNVFGFYMASEYVVVFNDWESATESLKKAIDRPPNATKAMPYRLGFGGASGSEWLKIRRMVSKVMKDMFINQARFETLAQGDAQSIAELILKRSEEPLYLKELFAESFFGNVLSLILGIKPPSNITLNLLKLVNTILQQLTPMALFNFSPKLSVILQLLGIERKINMRKELKLIYTIIWDIVHQKINNPDIEAEDSIISHMLKEIKQHSKRADLGNEDVAEIIRGTVMALIFGGADTTGSSFSWLLIAMAEHPELQQKVQEEIDEVLGNDGTIFWAQRKNLPYTLATILESLRWKTVSALLIKRFATEEMEIHGYTIPKGTSIVNYAWALHNDPKYWKDPDRFIPERFLSANRKDVNMKPNSFVPFSFGKRNCPGQVIALMQLLQYFCIIMQKFRVVPEEGKNVKYKPSYRSTFQALDAKLRFIPRH